MRNLLTHQVVCRRSQFRGDAHYLSLKQKQEQLLQRRISQWGLGHYSIPVSRHRSPSTDMKVYTISQRNFCPHHNTLISECIMVSDVLEQIVCASYFPDSYTLVICLLGKSRHMREYNITPKHVIPILSNWMLQHHFIHDSLNWTDRGRTQIRDILPDNPSMCNL